MIPMLIDSPITFPTARGALTFAYSQDIRNRQTFLKCEYRGYETIAVMEDWLEPIEELDKLLCAMPKEIDYYLDAIWC